MTTPSPPPWSPDPAGGADQYLRTSQTVIGLDGSGRPSVALDGIPLPVDGGWQAAVDAGFAQVADSAERVGEPIAVTVIDTASDWTGRFVVQADRSIAEDVAPPPPARRRRGPFLALLAAAAVLVVGSAVVVGTQLRSADEPPPGPSAAAPATPGPATPGPATPGPATGRASASPSPAAPSPLPRPSPSAAPPALPAPAPTNALPPAAPRSAAPPPRGAPPAAGRPAPRGPEAAHPAPRTVPRPAPRPAPQPAPRPAPQPAPRPAPRPAPQPAPAAQGVSGRVIDGLGTCLGATATTLRSGSCLRSRPEQVWTRTPSGQLMTTGGCLTAVTPRALAVQPCRTGDATQSWRVGDRLIVNQGTGDCAVVRPSDKGQPVAATVRCGTGQEPTAQFVAAS